MNYFRQFERKATAMLAVAALATLGLTTTSLRAQEGYEAFSVAAKGAGGAYSVLPRGIDAIGLNPALLGIEPENRLQISVFPFSAFGLSAGPSFRDVSAVSDVFGQSNGFITNSTRQRLLAHLSNGALSGRGDVQVLAAYDYIPNVGGFGIAWTTHAAVRTGIPQSLLDYFYSAGSSLVSSALDPVSVDMQALWYSEYSLSFGRDLVGYSALDSTEATLGAFNVGAALKYVSGIGYAGLDPNNSLSVNQLSDSTQINANYRLQFAYPDLFNPQKIPNRFSLSFLSSSQAGSGIGLDLGTNIGLFRSRNGDNALSLSASVTDIGSITWTKNTVVRQATNASVGISHQTYDSAKVNTYLSTLSGTLKNEGSFTTPLPTTLRIGGALDLNAIGIALGGASMHLASEYSNGLTSTVGALQGGRLGVGLALNVPGSLFSLRGGVGYVTQSGSSGLSFGIGTTVLKRVAVDVATSNLTQLLGTSGSIDVAFSVRVLFD